MSQLDVSQLKVAASRVLGRLSASTGNVEELTFAQVAANLPLVTATAKGLVPNPGTATGRVFKDDLTWGTAGGDPWTRIKAVADVTNSTVTFANIDSFTFTPAANTDWVMEAYILIQTVATANMPLVRLNVGAGQAYGSGVMEWPASATTKGTVNAWWTTAASTSLAIPAGTAAVQGQPFLIYLWATGRSGASPTAITLQFAAEIAAANAAVIKAGSHMRWMTIP